MAQGIMEKALSEDLQLMKMFTVDSSGISAYTNEGAGINAILVLRKEFGIDISNHKAKLFDLALGLNAEIILTMTSSHKQAICSKFPSFSTKTFTLKEYIHINLNKPSTMNLMDIDISDPYGMSENIYKHCSLELNAAISQLMEILKKRYIG